ncbi:histidine kinase [Dokdonia pacifica]|uniref:2TM domain-containing protein n=1 Tax=Dokdonia pacifica TaxID=1627892 RepID=A0A238YNP7_9FLAO|nr:2TM domain-containing protein [Dokdonia pacifica]GGG11185.1 histidine kinase [Dokdonia pacifica]SNR72428.1 2TM domain-containing protein [Dokdonia pacifica]
MKDILKEFGKAFVFGLVFFIVHGIILYLIGNPWYGGEVFEFFFQNQVYSVTLYMVNMFVFKTFIDRYGVEFWKMRNVAVGLLSGVMATFITVFLIRVFLQVIRAGKPLETFLESERLQDYYLSIIIALVSTGLFYGFYYWKNIQDRKVKQSKIIAKTASAKFDALKNQLDPHFLFNSLNVLASLIEENPRQAQKFTTSLSKVYRYVLEQKNKELVPVDEELAFARTYMNLIKMRFEDSIIVEIPDHISNSELKVVPLSLQLLLENAVKHNMVTPSKKLHIQIYEDGNRLVVKNNIQAKQVVKKSSGVGLHNIKQRYHLLTDSEVRIKNDGATFEIAIPMLIEQKAFVPKQKEYIEDKRYKRAKEKVEKLKGFYIHFTIYLIMVPVFIFLNARSGSFPWAIFPIGGWGWGVIGHAAETFGWNPIFNKAWEAKKIDELMNDDDF